MRKYKHTVKNMREAKKLALKLWRKNVRYDTFIYIESIRGVYRVAYLVPHEDILVTSKGVKLPQGYIISLKEARRILKAIENRKLFDNNLAIRNLRIEYINDDEGCIYRNVFITKEGKVSVGCTSTTIRAIKAAIARSNLLKLYPLKGQRLKVSQ